MLKRILFSFIFFLLCNISKVQSIEISGKPIVVDGDTLKINGKKIRLFGIDAPESKQVCQKPFINFIFFTFYKDYACGQIATIQLKKIIGTETITCSSNTKDKYNRLIAICYFQEKNINALMVKKGQAVAYRKFSKDYLIQEEYAKRNKIGIWSGKFLEPEKWRKKNK